MDKILYVINRELEFLFVKRKAIAFYCLVFPLIMFFIVLFTFSSRVVSNIPVAVIDNSLSVSSQEFMRALKANPQLNVKYAVQTYDDALELLDAGKVFGIIVIDKNYEKDLLGLKGASVAVFANNQYLMVGSMMAKAVMASGDAVAKKYRELTLMNKEVPSYSLDSYIAPIDVSETLLYNPDMNYIHFLVLGLISAILQLFIAMTIVFSQLTEIKTGRAIEIKRIIGENPFHIVGAKTFIYTVIYFAMFIVMLSVLVFFYGLPLRGSMLLILIAGFSFTVFTCSTAVFITGFTSNLRLGLSAAAVYSAPAFAYFGVTFPVEAMPALGRFWAEILPGTHLNRILVNETVRGGNFWASIGDIAFMLIFSFILFYIGSNMYSRWARDESKWGPEV